MRRSPTLGWHERLTFEKTPGGKTSSIVTRGKAFGANNDFFHNPPQAELWNSGCESPWASAQVEENRLRLVRHFDRVGLPGWIDRKHPLPTPGARRRLRSVRL